MPDAMIDDFYAAMGDVVLDAYGILDTGNRVHTLGTDSKIIGRVFEMFTQPVLENIAERHHLNMETPKSQTVYPDFVLLSSPRAMNKIAIDVKTTYVDRSASPIKFTLGSFASYMRDNKKNIAYRYTEYSKHYVIGFVYIRNDNAQESRVYEYEHRDQIVCPYREVRFFMQEKYKIAGDKPGSGNTENIGSIASRDFDDFKYGRGPFAVLGHDVYDLYWKYYPKYRSRERSYSSLEEFIAWLPEHINDVELLHPFDRNQILDKIMTFHR